MPKIIKNTKSKSAKSAVPKPKVKPTVKAKSTKSKPKSTVKAKSTKSKPKSTVKSKINFNSCKTNHMSWKYGDLCKGCQACINGEKLVLFATGISTVPNCLSCPSISTKWQKDYTYANEMRVVKKQDIIEEAKLSNATGAGITGGDTLMKIDRVATYIEMLKAEFGKDFHIHLYTPIKHITNLKLERLYDSGLDEIRLLPDIDDKQDWQKIKFAKKFKWDVGLEILAIPSKEKILKDLISYSASSVNFLIINELEFGDDHASEIKKEDVFAITVEGSEKTGLELLKFAKTKKLNTHFCSSRAKDAVQFKNRIKRRAENIAKEYDYITEDGTLIRGVIYIENTLPDVGYRHSLEIISRRPTIKKLFKIKRDLQRKFNIPFNLMDVDEYKLRITTSPKIIDDFKVGLKKMKLRPAIVEEYPTYEGMEVDIDFI